MEATPRVLDIMKRLSITDAEAMPQASGNNFTLREYFEKRISPVEYLSKTFSYPVMLLSVMFDTGCILSGSRALEFFLPGSTRPDSDWDFYVPGYAESVADIISALSLSGVTWDLEGQRLEKELMANGSVTVRREVLIALSTWYGRFACTPPQRTGTALHDIALEFRRLKHEEGTNSNGYTITRHSDGMINITAKDTKIGENVSIYEDGLGRQFSLLQGSIKTASGKESVQLMIGTNVAGMKSCMSFVKDFYASHVQCFLSGWCAVHLHYKRTHKRQAILWQSRGQNPAKVRAAVDKYERRGFEFSTSKEMFDLKRTLHDQDSLLIDYGDIYRPYIKQCDHGLLNDWLYERRQNLQGISWVESDSRILGFQSSWEDCFRKCSRTFANAEPCLSAKRWRRLGNIVAHNTMRPNPHTSRGFHSVVGWHMFKQGWQMRLLEESGTVISGLRDATPWSWVL
ncbi:hypothetical protein HDV57DRAFT_488136 [Trichoderma longibrachiatum]